MLNYLTINKRFTGCNLLGLGQHTAYSPTGLNWHLWDEGQLSASGPHVTTSSPLPNLSGSPFWHGFSFLGRHIGTEGQGHVTHSTATNRHVSPSPRQEILEHGSTHSHVLQPSSSIWKPCSHSSSHSNSEQGWSVSSRRFASSSQLNEVFRVLVLDNSNPRSSTHL